MGHHIRIVDTGSPCATCPVRNRAVCSVLSDEELKSINEISRIRSYAPGDEILADDEPTTFFANVQSGVVKLEKSAADGRQQIVGLVFPTDFLGRAYSVRNPYFAEAATDVRLCTFPHSEFERLISRFPDLEHRMFENTLNELDAARDWMFLLGRKTARERVASFIYAVAKRQGPPAKRAGSRDGPCVPAAQASFELPLTRAEIADFLGLTVETVSRQISKLRKDGVIEVVRGREIRLPDVPTIVAIAHGDSARVA